MADDTLEKRVEQLAAQVHALTATVEQLAARLAVTPTTTPVVHPPSLKPATVTTQPVGHSADAPDEVTEEILSWAGKTALLPRLSTLCFLLVVALILRTITDNNIINTLLGSILGMAYATILMMVGWYKYGKGSPLAPVFAACGAALMALIVVETHTRFQSLPLVPAYLTLMATGMAMAVISYRYTAFVPISVGTLGMCLAGAAIDYPNPFFPYLAMILWTANLLGFFATSLKRCSWLRWIVLAVSMLMLYLWSFKLTLPLARHDQMPEALALSWFFPVLAILTVTFAGIALTGIVRAGSEKISRFDFFLPLINVTLMYANSYYVVNAWGGSKHLLGWVGIATAVVQFSLAAWLVRRHTAGGRGENAFILAGATLLAFALPAASGSFPLSLPALSIAGFFLMIISGKWQNGGTRVISYLLQIYPAVALTIFLTGSRPAGVDFLLAIPAGLAAVCSLFHYQLARRSAPSATVPFFSRFDQRDHSAVALLLAALATGFFMLRDVIYQIIVMLPGEVNNSFRCAQSILITSAAAGLMLFAVRRNNREIRNVAILVTVIGAVKVFLYDLLGTHGMPLVLSVFAFGLAAAIESIALGRWQKGAARSDTTTTNGGKAGQGI
ncbi:DUF2339 domain-containing protein [Geobacter sp. AOG1]|uniref:DUF2339 domain-containing protein n=1 Tax=Geobacter sp. AOG1 TaxID=1566346 RepID=UPI001CC6C62E|nr:DUF2339 domain-containing protein [Geobacter sp. AOG1]GFE57485.1 hypothetical protein AOG1_13650 [Geobacter sp. AOG1]